MNPFAPLVATLFFILYTINSTSLIRLVEVYDLTD